MPEGGRLRLFQGHGVELEYMIVDAASLDVRPLAERLLLDDDGQPTAEVEHGPLAWSNELVLHLIELKTNGPVSSLEGVSDAFQADVRAIDALLAPHGARLMPGAMHPWMDPHSETRLWPHDYGPVYATYDRIFGCRGHGWSNLQSTHLNLPFADDAEFERLHAAIRLLLPLLPALAASSPVVEGRPTGTADNRLRFYRTNSLAVPSVAGLVVPESVTSRVAYERDVLGRIYADMKALDPDGVLRHEFVNSRGAIARFDRHAIEIRVLDVQECPRMDVALAALITDVLRALVEERWIGLAEQQAWDTARLAATLWDTVEGGERTVLTDAGYVAALVPGWRAPCRAGELAAALTDAVWPAGSEAGRAFRPEVDLILERGTLASRLTEALGADPGRSALRDVYRRLCRCLRRGEPFLP